MAPEFVSETTHLPANLVRCGFFDQTGHRHALNLHGSVILAMAGVPTDLLTSLELLDFELVALPVTEDFGFDHGTREQRTANLQAPGVPGEQDLLELQDVIDFGRFPKIEHEAVATLDFVLTATISDNCKHIYLNPYLVMD